MPVRIERSGRVLMVIHSRAEAHSVNPEHAEALYQTFVALDADDSTDVAVLWGEGERFAPGLI